MLQVTPFHVYGVSNPKTGFRIRVGVYKRRGMVLYGTVRSAGFLLTPNSICLHSLLKSNQLLREHNSSIQFHSTWADKSHRHILAKRSLIHQVGISERIFKKMHS